MTKRQRIAERHGAIAAVFEREREALRSDPAALLCLDAVALERTAARMHVSVRTVRRIVGRLQ